MENDVSEILKVPVLLEIGIDIGNGMIFEEESFNQAMAKGIDKGLFVHYGQEASDELDLMSAIGKVLDFVIEDDQVFLNVDFIDVSFSQATVQRLKRGWTTTSMKALGEKGDDLVVRDLEIIGFVESKKE